MILGAMQSQNIEKFINVHDSPNEHFGTKEIPTDILQKCLGIINMVVVVVNPM